MNVRRGLLISLCFAMCLFTPTSGRAQDIDCNKLDLSTITTLINQAQAKADSGDQAGAMQLLSQAQTQLATIQTSCGAADEVVLSETYEDKANVFSVKYPAGFEFTDDTRFIFNPTPGFSSVSFSISSTDSDKGRYVAVGVGSAVSIMKAFGGSAPEDANANLDPVGMLKLIVKHSNVTTVTVEDVQSFILNDKPAASLTYPFGAPDQALSVKAYLVLTQLSDGRMGIVLGIVSESHLKEMEVLVRAIATSITLKS